MEIPTLAQAEHLLREAESMNPGPWAAHSRVAADSARRIAERVPGMHAEAAYILGLLHDIGRRNGVHGMRHITDGYYFMESLGCSLAARICLTHSFPLQDAHAMLGWDGSPEDERFVHQYIATIEYDDYDRLIQLADSVSLPGGCCLLEKRMIDVSMRYWVNDYTTKKWKAQFALLHVFEAKIGASVYSLLPNIIENTFGEAFHPLNIPADGVVSND